MAAIFVKHCVLLSLPSRFLIKLSTVVSPRAENRSQLVLALAAKAKWLKLYFAIWYHRHSMAKSSGGGIGYAYVFRLQINSGARSLSRLWTVMTPEGGRMQIPLGHVARRCCTILISLHETFYSCTRMEHILRKRRKSRFQPAPKRQLQRDSHRRLLFTLSLPLLSRLIKWMNGHSWNTAITPIVRIYYTSGVKRNPGVPRARAARSTTNDL